MKASNLASMIDHTLLKPDGTAKDIDRLCQEALQFGFGAVCVNPWWVSRAAEQLKESSVEVCTVVGFPLGATTTEAKVAETKQAIADGASEIDMVINIGAFKSRDDRGVEEDIRAVVRAAAGRTVKVILETGLLAEEEIQRACELAKAAGAHFVKTSTGFGPGGATVEAVRLMRGTVGPEMGVKASGGVRTLAAAKKMISAGANRIGTSSGVAIMEECQSDG
ncbi:MAG: deoxyribose-phosphate aldolase [Planifilum sp.]|jgi:deoxyribose-phosphate aldolase